MQAREPQPATPCRSARFQASQAWGLNRQPVVATSVVMNLSWKRPLVYLLAPILIFLCFVGFPPPFAPPARTRPAQEQSVPDKERKAVRK